MAGRSTERRGTIIDFDLHTTYSRISSDVQGRGGAHLDAMEVVARVYANHVESVALMEERRIGNVSTGLSEEAVAKSLKQHKYTSMEEEERCCICQEEYVEGDELGKLDCAHHFHSSCIKQWLSRKNLCPICKNTAL